ncbi:MAG: carbon storage regulator CsrA [Planctomycetaceae bacterium]|nr:carbon storage regulator CsrA [Planctomycetaceae bacterium]
MLVLSRKKNESIVIDDRIRITVVEVRGDKVRLGVEAPRDVAIHREEVYQALRQPEASGPVNRTSDSKPVVSE